MSEKQYEGGQADSRMVLENDETPSRFRPKYRKLADDELERMNAVKAKAAELEDAIENAYDFLDQPLAESKALAMTKLEESVMWAVKGLTG